MHVYLLYMQKLPLISNIVQMDNSTVAHEKYFSKLT